MPLLHRSKKHQAEKEAKEHAIAEQELAGGNLKQWHRHEMKAHRAAGRAGNNVVLAPQWTGTEFGGVPLGGPGVGVAGIGGPSPPFRSEPHGFAPGASFGAAGSRSPLGIPPGSTSGRALNPYEQQVSSAMLGGTALMSGGGMSPMGWGPNGPEPGYGGPTTPAAAIANTYSSSRHPVATGNGFINPSMGGGSAGFGMSMSGQSFGTQGRSKYDMPTRRTLGSPPMNMLDDDFDDTLSYTQAMGMPPTRGGYLPTSYSDNPMMISGRAPFNPSGLPMSMSAGAMSGGASPYCDYPTLNSRGGRSRHTYGDGVMIGVPQVIEETTIVDTGFAFPLEGNTLPPKVIVEGPAAPVVITNTSSMGLTPSGLTTTSSTTTILPPLPAGEEVMCATPLPGIAYEGGMGVLPPTIVDEEGNTIAGEVVETDIIISSQQFAVEGAMPTMPPRYADSPQLRNQQYVPYVGSSLGHDREELERLEMEVPGLVDRMMVLREHLAAETMRRPSTPNMYADLACIPRVASSRLPPDMQAVEMAAVRQLQGVDAARVAAMEDELLLLRRRIEDPTGHDTRAELRRLEARADTLLARRVEDEFEVNRLTAIRNQEIAKQRQMQRLAIMIEEQHEQEQRTLADLQTRSVLEGERLYGIDEDLAFRRSQLRLTDSEAHATVRRMDDLSRALTSSSTLSTLNSLERNQGAPILTPLIVEPPSPVRVPRAW